MCQAWDEHYEDGRNEGIATGRNEERKEMAIALLKEKVFTISKIAELTKLSIEEINQLQNDHLQNA